MAREFRLDRALGQLDAVVYRLADVTAHGIAPAGPLGDLYTTFLEDLEEADEDEERGDAVLTFFNALEEMPEIQPYIAEFLDASRGPVTRGFAAPPPLGTGLRDSLPPSLAAAAPVAANGGTRAEPPAGAEPPPGLAPLVRFPDLDYPSRVLLGARTSLTVLLLLEPPRPDAADTGFEITVETEDELPELELVVRAPGFDVEGTNTHVLEVLRDEATEHRFVLIPREEGTHTLRVDFYQAGRRLTTARRDVVVAAVIEGDAPPAETVDSGPLEFARAGTVAPDLELCVEASGDRTLSFTLHSTRDDIGYHHSRMGSVTLQGSPLDELQTVYAELSKMAGAKPVSAEDTGFQERRIASLGRDLWERLFPGELKSAYWEFAPKVKSLLVTSDEPWIPWEVVKPFRFDAQNARIDAPHLSESFDIARWLAGPGPADTLPVARVRPVAPAVVNLDSVRDELAFLETLSTVKAGVTPDVPYSDRARVLDLFEAGTFSIVHFAAHGVFDAAMPDNSGISLTDGALRPSDLFARFGGARPRPLVFINACHGARMQFVFTGMGGWADRLIRQSQVAAFVGAAWEVNDGLALHFARAFYEALLRDNRTLGEAFRVAREAIRAEAPWNSTWLAYVLYADPGTRAEVMAPGV